MKEEIKGLTQSEVHSLLQKYGHNRLDQEKNTSIFLLLFAQYTNLITLILLGGGAFSFIIQDYLDAFFILFVLIINGLFGFIQEFRAEKTLEKLKNLTIPYARVIREGHEREINATTLVPGDIVVLREGDRIPADGEIISDVELEVDEAIFTGESLPAEKKKGDIILSGTFIIHGRAQMRVTKTGLATKLGEIAQEIQEVKKPKTPLMQNLNRLGKRMVLLGFILSSLIIPISILQHREIREVILTAISIAVAMVPEGLPLVVTIALAVGAYKMARAKTIVRKMSAIETLGSTNVILTDKTGTLTQNNMSVKTHWLADKDHFPLLLRACAVANTASFALKEGEAVQEVLGDKTDGALLLFIQENVSSVEEFIQEGALMHEEPFNTETKLIETTWKGNRETYDFIRGAPESIIKRIDSHDHHEIDEKLQEFGKRALRTIGFAYKKPSESVYTFLGLVGIYDPPRLEAKKAVKDAKGAGIRVVMVTGDNPITAKSIAEEIGLIEQEDLVITHDEIEKMSDEELLPRLPHVRIFARMLPEDKLRLVRLYKQAGMVVAVTGDGVNDALALSEANIGVAMGGSGTDVAREAADIVIMDDNLDTVVRAVEEGRGIFDNILKVVIFLISSNLAEFLVIFLAVALGFPIPFSTTQILWINLVSDGLPALALATDTKRTNLLKQKPRNIMEQILSNKRILTIAKITIPFSLILVGVYAVLLSQMPLHYARVGLFNLLVIGEMGIIFMVRGGIRPINRFLIISVAATLLLQLIITINPFLRGIFS